MKQHIPVVTVDGDRHYRRNVQQHLLISIYTYGAWFIKWRKNEGESNYKIEGEEHWDSESFYNPFKMKEVRFLAYEMTLGAYEVHSSIVQYIFHLLF